MQRPMTLRRSWISGGGIPARSLVLPPAPALASFVSTSTAARAKLMPHLREHGSRIMNTACPRPGGTRRNPAGSTCCSSTHQDSGAARVSSRRASTPRGEARADKDGGTGDGGYFIFWPAAGTRVLMRALLAPAPPWLIDLLNPRPKPISAFPTAKAGAAPCSASIRGALRVLAQAREGERNSALFWASCRMGEAVRAGAVTESEALALLTSVGRQVGLLDREIVRTARSGLREGVSL
jgi:hypothetical protein